MKSQWRQICDNLQKTVESGTYKVWIEPLEADLQNGVLKLTAPNPYVANWVGDRLSATIAAAAEAVLGAVVRVQIEAAPAKERPAKPLRVAQRAPVTPAASQDVSVAKTPGSLTQQLYLPLSMPQRSSFTWRHDFASFVVGPCNNMAFAAARDIARSSACVDTLFLSSGPGLGKTHLAQAVGQALCSSSNLSRPRVEYLSAESFASGFVQAMRAKDIDSFKGRFRNVDVLLLEDVHFLQGKEKMQTEVLSTIKFLQERGSRVVLTSSFSPRELEQVDDSLVSRFCSGFLAGIDKPDFDTRRKMLRDKVITQTTPLGDDICDLLAERLTGDVRQLESCLQNVLLRARLLNCPVSYDMALEVLGQYVQHSPFIDLDAIIRRVCEAFGLAPDSLTSRSRKADLVNARNTIFYLARKHTDLSLQGIGERFNRRHSTVLKGIASVERELTRETPLGRQIGATLTTIERRCS